MDVIRLNTLLLHNEIIDGINEEEAYTRKGRNISSYAQVSTYDDNKLHEKLMRGVFFFTSFERYENYYKALMSLNL